MTPRMQVGVATARERDRTELLLGRAELEHVPRMIVAK
jgi:hypothetical protein